MGKELVLLVLDDALDYGVEGICFPIFLPSTPLVEVSRWLATSAQLSRKQGVLPSAKLMASIPFTWPALLTPSICPWLVDMEFLLSEVACGPRRDGNHNISYLSKEKHALRPPVEAGRLTGQRSWPDSKQSPSLR